MSFGLIQLVVLPTKEYDHLIEFFESRVNCHHEFFVFKEEQKFVFCFFNPFMWQ